MTPIGSHLWKEDAMGAFQLTITIDRPPEDVFAVIAEPESTPLWYEAVTQVIKTTPGPITTGARFQITRSLPGGQARNDMEITEYVPNRRITLESRHGPTPFRYRYDLEPNRLGTVLTLDGRISTAGLPRPAVHLDRLATKLFKHGMRQNLNQLTRLVEASQASAP
jgi:uncharacterized protein YndB with AHSA1/START domain